MMTLQEIFNTSVLGVIGQGGRSVSSYGRCVYRDLNGRKCAVGWLIKDEYYRTELEGKSTTTFAVNKALNLSGVDLSPETMLLLDDIQYAHDGASDLDDFIKCAREVAAEYGLTFPEDKV